METYHTTTQDIYRDAALKPNVGLCCTTTPIWAYPGLSIPKVMQEMNYGCGSTVHARDLVGSPRVLYVGVGGGMELLQFAYFSRQPSGVVGIDVVDEMLQACQNNMAVAAEENEWFDPSFIDLRKGDALHLPVEDASVDVAAQNCLFNIFTREDLKSALREMYRVLRPGGRLVLSDPVSESPMPASLQADERLRALCLSGAVSLQDYLGLITEAGFATVEVRAKRPYRILAPGQYDTDRDIYIESVEVAAMKDPMPDDGPCIFTGKTAIYYGDQEYFDDKKGHVLLHNQPLSICDKTAGQLAALGIDQLKITDSTYFYDGGGTC